MGWPVAYPSRYYGAFAAFTLSHRFSRLARYTTHSSKGKLFAFELLGTTNVIVKITSRIGAERGWRRAGYFVQFLLDTPISNPHKQIERVYLDTHYFSFSGDGFPYYFEFWPHIWIADYQIEIWVKLANPLSKAEAEAEDGGVLLFGVGDSVQALTFFGELINFPL